MNKSGTLITSALLTFGIAATAMAANSPDATTTTAAATYTGPAASTIGPKEDQRAVDTSPPKSAGKPTTSTHAHKRTHRPATPAPTTTK